MMLVHTFEFKDIKFRPDVWAEFVKKTWYVSPDIVGIESPDQGILVLELREGGEEDTAALYGRLLELLKEEKQQNRGEARVLQEIGSEPVTFHTDVMERLIRSGDLYETGRGRYAYSGTAKRVMDQLDARFVQFAREMGAREYDFPATMSWDMLEKSNYLSEFPQNLTFLAALPRDSQIYNQYSSRPVLDKEQLELTGLFFSPTVCIHLYDLLKNQTLEGPFKATVKGKCFRNEYIQHTSLERLSEFSMREIVFIGSKEFVAETRERLMKQVIRMTERLGLRGRIEVAYDPFFISKHMNKIFHQKVTELKYELRLDLDQSGKSVAVASFNIHKTHFSDSFHIRSSGEELWTGCCAFGVERWAYAVFTQLGLAEEQLIREICAVDAMVNEYAN